MKLKADWPSVKTRSLDPENSTALVASAELSVEAMRASSEARSIDALAVAKAFVRSSDVRDRYLPSDAVSDPAWDILMELFIADATGRRLSITDVCTVRGLSATTGQRHLRRLAGMAIIAKTLDTADRRRTFIELLPDARSMLTGMLIDMGRTMASTR